MATAAPSVSPASSPAFAAYDAWNEAVELEFFPDTAHGGRPTSIPAIGGGYLIRGPGGRFISGTTETSSSNARPVYLDMEADTVDRLAARAGAKGDSREALADAVLPTLYLWPEKDGSLLDLHVRRLRRWQASGRTGPPPCLAILAFFSLAAEGMRTDEVFRSNNYYSRLAELLGFDPATERQAVDKLSREFRKDSLTLWNALNSWLLEAGGARGLPTAYSFDWRSFVGVPISQALLREEERLGLRDLFVRYRLRPGQEIAASDMLRLLEDWLPGSDLNPNLKHLFGNAEAKARIADIAVVELAHWDGTGPSSAHGETATADVLLLAASLRRQPRPQLHLSLVLRGVSRMPVGRYNLVEDAAPAAEAAFRWTDGSVTLVDPPSDGWRRFEAGSEIGFPDLLVAPVRLRGAADGNVVTRKPRRLVILERDEEFRVAVEVERIQLARENIVLAHRSLAEDVDALLRAYSREGLRRWEPAELRGLPVDWIAWTSVELVEVPPEPDNPEAQDLSTLIPLEWTKVAFGGGITLPGTATWLRSAPPEVRLAAFVRQEVVASLTQTDWLTGERREDVDLVEFEGSAMVPLDQISLGDGDYRVSLREVGERGKPLASAAFRLRSGDSPRLLTEIPGHVAHVWDGDSAEGVLTASLLDTAPEATPQPSPAAAGALADELSRIPKTLPAAAALGMDAEISDIEPIVEAVAGALTGCLLGGGHRYRLEEAGRDVMQRRRAAARKMIPAQCMECGHQKLFPPHLRHAEHTRGPRKVAPASRTAVAPRGVGDARVFHEPISLAAGFEHLLDALSYARAGRWPLFERLAQQISDEPWFPLEAARLLSALGHVDLVIDLPSGRPRAWAVAAPKLIVTCSGDAVLAGARSEALVSTLREHAEGLGGSFARTATPGAPDTVRVAGVEGDDLDELAQAIAEQLRVGLSVDHSGAAGLAASLPSLEDVASRLPRFDWPQVPTERFDFKRNAWDTGEVDGIGAYKFVTRPLRFGARVEWGRDARLICADSRLVKWLAAGVESATLLAYDPATQTLVSRLGAQLPGLFERAAVLASGRPPEKRVDGTVAYRDVSSLIAATLHAALVSASREHHAR